MASFKLVDYSSGEESNEESDKNVINIEKFVQEVLLEEILLNVVNLSEVKLDSVIKIDKNPSFDVYRPKKRLLSECSSVVIIGDDQSTRSSSSDSELSSSDDENLDDDNAGSDEIEDSLHERIVKNPPKVKGELDLKDLPPIADLTITVPEEKCFLIGHVKSCVDNLVVVESIKGLPAIDLDSVLFLEKGSKTLGHIFDVFGRVDHPCYCVRFNSSNHIQSRSVTPGLDVYYAPETEHTTFIFIEQLRKLKGSDASWKHNHEAPPENFSDDEAEELAKSKKAQKRRQKNLRKENCFYNGSQQSSSSLFYRSARSYRPQDFGPIQWNSRHVPSTSYFQTPDFSRPPPGLFPNVAQPTVSSMPPPSFHYPAYQHQWYQTTAQASGYPPFHNNPSGTFGQSMAHYVFNPPGPPPPPPTTSRPPP